MHRKDEPLQFEVYYAKTNDAVDSVRQEKVLEQSQKIKNPSAVDLQKLRVRATTGLDQMSLGLSATDMADIRDDMARSSKDADTVFTEPALQGKSLREAFGSSEEEKEIVESGEEEDSAKKKTSRQRESRMTTLRMMTNKGSSIGIEWCRFHGRRDFSKMKLQLSKRT
eukprot:6484643-Amphidinium_carterae.2